MEWDKWSDDIGERNKKRLTRQAKEYGKHLNKLAEVFGEDSLEGIIECLQADEILTMPPLSILKRWKELK